MNRTLKAIFADKTAQREVEFLHLPCVCHYSVFAKCNLHLLLHLVYHEVTHPLERGLHRVQQGRQQTALNRFCSFNSRDHIDVYIKEETMADIIFIYLKIIAF